MSFTDDTGIISCYNMPNLPGLNGWTTLNSPHFSKGVR